MLLKLIQYVQFDILTKCLYVFSKPNFGFPNENKNHLNHFYQSKKPDLHRQDQIREAGKKLQKSTQS